MNNVNVWNPVNAREGFRYQFEQPISQESTIIGIKNDEPKERKFLIGMLEKITNDSYHFIGRKIGCKRRRYFYTVPRI